MRSIPKRIFVNDKRANERGASLVMTIMVAALLLAAGGALIWTTCMSTTLADAIHPRHLFARATTRANNEHHDDE